MTAPTGIADVLPATLPDDCPISVEVIDGDIVIRCDKIPADLSDAAICRITAFASGEIDRQVHEQRRRGPAGGGAVTVDLRDRGVTPEHHDTQAALDILVDRLNAATDEVAAVRNETTQAAFAAAWAAYDRGRRAFTAAAYETAYGPAPIDLQVEARGWLSDCFPHDDFADVADEQIRRAMEVAYEGGWAAFVAACGGGS